MIRKQETKCKIFGFWCISWSSPLACITNLWIVNIFDVFFQVFRSLVVGKSCCVECEAITKALSNSLCTWRQLWTRSASTQINPNWMFYVIKFQNTEKIPPLLLPTGKWSYVLSVSRKSKTVNRYLEQKRDLSTGRNEERLTQTRAEVEKEKWNNQKWTKATKQRLRQ